jgi:hypothetical protein
MSHGKGGYECDMEVDDDEQAGASMHNDRKRKRDDDDKKKTARARVPREGRFITKNTRRPPPTALAVLRQSSVRPFKMQRMLHPRRCIPSAHNFGAALATNVRDLGSNMNTMLTGIGGGLTKMFCETVNAVKDVAVAALAAAPPLAQATFPWVGQTTIALSGLTGIALQNPGAFTTMVASITVARRGAWGVLMDNLGYAPPTPPT